MTRARRHRGSIGNSMATAVPVTTLDQLVAIIQNDLAPYPAAPRVTTETIHVKPYGYDGRIGWNTHIVMVDNYGVWGFTDGPANEPA